MAAIAVSLSLAVVAAALMARSIGALRGARADFARTQAEYLLAGVQQRSAIAMTTGSSSLSVIAEPEAAKISVAAAADLDTAVLSRLGVKDPVRLQAWLRDAAVAPVSPSELVAANDARLWRNCAPAMISAFGRATAMATPVSGSSEGRGPSSRLGEVWRLRARSADGWTDERIVRFNGAPGAPGAVIWRRFYRSAGGGELCAAIFAQPAHG